MKSLKTLLNTTLHNKQPSWHTTLITQWHDIVGNLANIMTLEKIHNTTLIIGVYEHSWAQELYMLSDVIIKTINQHLETPYVKKLSFKLATHVTRTLPEPRTTSDQPIITPYLLTKTEQQALSTIKDEELSTALIAFLSRCKQQKTVPSKKKISS